MGEAGRKWASFAFEQQVDELTEVSIVAWRGPVWAAHPGEPCQLRQCFPIYPRLNHDDGRRRRRQLNYLPPPPAPPMPGPRQNPSDNLRANGGGWLVVVVVVVVSLQQKLH